MHVTWWEEKIVQQAFRHLHRGSSRETMSVRAYSNTSMYNAPLHAHGAVHVSANNRETPRESLCEHACTPKGQPALLRFNSLTATAQK